MRFDSIKTHPALEPSLDIELDVLSGRHDQITMAATTVTAIDTMLPSGPVVPPLSQVGPMAWVVMRAPFATRPESATP